MADNIILTDGNDVYVFDQDQWTTIEGRGGDDKITLKRGANVLAGPGNDTIINDTGQNWPSVVYWNSGNPVFIDLGAGYALDGFGTRDTLVNIYSVQTHGPGDTVLGSEGADQIWLNGWDWAAGRAFADGKGGNDQVTAQGVIAEFAITTSADGRTIVLSKKDFSAELKNVESIRFWFWDGNNGVNDEYSVASLIDFAKVGQQTIISSQTHGWHGGNLGPGVTLTYSFMTAAPTYGGGEGGTGFQAPTADYIAAVRQILSRLQTETGMQFQEVADSAASYGQLRFGANQQTTTKGYAYIPGTVSDARAGDVWLDIETLSVLKAGQEGWQVLLHEIGHALGLSHPIPEADASGKTVLLNEWNWNGYTVMSENLGSSRLYQEWFGELDMQALRYFYGSGPSGIGHGNTTYRFTDNHGRSIFTVSDADGWDVLDLSSLTYGATIDLRPGALSSVGVTPQGYLAWNNLLFGSGTVIEEIIGTSYDDVLIGSGADQVFHARGGNDSIDGGAGTDTVVVSGLLKDYTVYLSEYSGQWQVEHRPGELGSVNLADIQLIRFNDLRVLLEGSEAAVLLTGSKGGYSFKVSQNGEVSVVGADRGVIKDIDQVSFSDGQEVRLMNLLPKAYLSGAGPYDAKVQAYFVTTLGRGATLEELKNFSSILASQQGSVWKDANGQTGTSGSLVGALFAMAEFQPFVEAAKDSQNYGQIVRDMYGRMTGGLVPDDDILDYYVNQLSSSIKLRGLANAILNDLSLMPRADGILSQPNTWKVNMFDQMTPADYMGFLTQLELVGIDVTNLDSTGTLSEPKTPASI